MPTCVVLLRAVNVGGTGKRPMADFRKLLAGPGSGNVETYIQSGNAAFDAPGSAATCSKAIAAALMTILPAPPWCWSAPMPSWAASSRGIPFSLRPTATARASMPSFSAPSPPRAQPPGSIASSRKYPARRNRYCLAGNTLYLPLPDGAADSRFTPRPLSAHSK